MVTGKNQTFGGEHDVLCTDVELYVLSHSRNLHNVINQCYLKNSF